LENILKSKKRYFFPFFFFLS